MLTSKIRPVASGGRPNPTQAGSGGGSATLAVLLTGTFMASMDVAIVNVAGPAITSGLALSGAALQAVVSGYTVAYAALLITGARLGDDHGHRRLFLFGLAGFTLASLACGLAWAGPVLIGARVVQGLTAAAMVPQVITVIQLRYTGAARARALALFATTISSAVVVGQVLGGALVSANLAGSSWRSVFLVNVPVGIILLVVGARVLPHTRAEQPRRLDLPGAALLTSIVLLVMGALVFGRQAGWAWWVWAALAAAAVLGAGFAGHLHRLARRGGDPLVDLGLLRRAPVAIGLGIVCAQMVAYGGILFTLSLYLQDGLTFSALRAGLTFAPFALAFAATSLTAPRLSEIARRRAAGIGLTAMSAGYAGLAAATGAGGWNQALTLPLLAVAGAGFGAGYSPVITRTLAHVPPANARDASGLFNTVNQLSYAFGIATIGSVFLARTMAGNAVQTGPAIATAASACAALGLLAALLTVALTKAEHHSQNTAPADQTTPATSAPATTGPDRQKSDLPAPSTSVCGRNPDDH